MLFDEPVNGLDPDGVMWIRKLLRSLAAEGRTVLVSSHLMSEMQQTADHLVVLGRGRLLADSSMASFVAGHGSLEEAYFRLTAESVEYTGTEVA
jgi:ABC-2 type transport system ATP-binding protein